MRKKLILCLLCLGIALLGVSFICTPVTAAPPKGDPINFGLITAIDAPWGKTNKISMEIAVNEINEAGGILGRPVKLLIEDWKRQVPLAVAAYRKLVISEKCLFVFTEGSEGVMALQQEAVRLFSEYPHIQIGNYTAADKVTDVVKDEYEKYKFFFRPFPRAGNAYDPNFNVWSVLNDIGTKKLALVVEDTAFTSKLISGVPGRFPPIKDWIEKRAPGVKVVAIHQNSGTETMFLPLLELIARSGADTMFLLGAYTNHATFANQWADSSAKNIDVISWSGVSAYAKFWDMTRGSGLGWISQFPEVEIPYTDKTLPFLKKLREAGGGLMGSTYAAYDGPWIAKAAIEKVGNTKDVLAMIKAVEQGEVQHGFWKWAFDERHDPVMGYPYYPWTFAQHQGPGKYPLVYPPELVKTANPDDKIIRIRDLRKMMKKK